MRRFKRVLLGVVFAVSAVAGTAGWASGNAQQPVTGPPPGAAAWSADRSLGRALPDPARAEPERVAAFFAGLAPAERRLLLERHPLIVGNLDGVPVALRYEANARAVRGTPYERLARDGRRILAFDPRGRGQVAEVYGDLATARRVAVVVPGSDTDAGSFDRPGKGHRVVAGMAKALRDAAVRTTGPAPGHGPGHRADPPGAPGTATAVIAWTGYTTPVGVGIDAATGDLAEAGAPRLARFTRGLTAVGAPRPSLFCHSYGSVVCGLAAADAHASDIVVFGAPGMRADSVADLGTDARVWAARNADDWIARVPNVELFGLGHGEDPASGGFGARRVPAREAAGHDGYFAPGTDSLRAFAAIARGELR
ncbi:alpha/beta hydrolase [Streptomyces sp. NPDC006798]|uniref:alpha/beta hydrolase n=1 Tax=Streptomyces sp. NPDC006798 TaxID=3155462 RepID=UPI00340167C5